MNHSCCSRAGARPGWGRCCALGYHGNFTSTEAGRAQFLPWGPQGLFHLAGCCLLGRREEGWREKEQGGTEWKLRQGGEEQRQEPDGEMDRRQGDRLTAATGPVTLEAVSHCSAFPGPPGLRTHMHTRPVHPRAATSPPLSWRSGLQGRVGCLPSTCGH